MDWSYQNGIVNCQCGQTFHFTTVQDTISCINCGREYVVEQYVTPEIQEVEFVEEPPTEEVVQNGTDI